RFDYRVEHAYDEQGHRGTARTERSLVLSITQADSPPLRRGRRIWFDIELPPRGRWHACFSWKAIVDGDALEPPCCTRSRDGDGDGPGSGDQAWQDEATRFETPESRTLTPVVIEALERARGDLAALRLHRTDRDMTATTASAGQPPLLCHISRAALTLV